MKPENLELINSFGLAAAKYMTVLCALLWLCSVIFELTGKQPLKKQGFYRGVFWVIYLVSALVCGLFLKAVKIDEEKKAPILMVLLIISLIIANLTSGYFEITAHKAAVAFQKFWVWIKKDGRF